MGKVHAATNEMQTVLMDWHKCTWSCITGSKCIWLVDDLLVLEFPCVVLDLLRQHIGIHSQRTTACQHPASPLCQASTSQHILIEWFCLIQLWYINCNVVILQTLSHLLICIYCVQIWQGINLAKGARKYADTFFSYLQALQCIPVYSD